MKKISKKSAKWFIETKSQADHIETFQTPEQAGQFFNDKPIIVGQMISKLKLVGWWTGTINNVRTFIQTQEFHDALQSVKS